MFLLIHLLEITLFLLVATLGYRVFKAYQSEYKRLPVSNCELSPQTSNTKECGEYRGSCSEDKIVGKSIVEAYIDDCFMTEHDAFDNPLSALEQAEQRYSKTSSIDSVTKSKTGNADRSISSKVMDAMMAEADLACAS